MRETELDLIGLKCPLPAMKTAKALRALARGDMLTIRCSDPLAKIDIPNLVRETGDRLDDQRNEGGMIIFRIVKG